VDAAESVGSRYRVLALAASAGGVVAIRTVLAGLPADLPVPVLVVQHLAPHYATGLADILGRATALSVRLARDGERIAAGTVYVAPPDHHLIVAPDGTARLTDDDPVNYVRPSADPLFASLAEVYGPGVLACVLTGTGRDGSAGASEVLRRGGTLLVEDPETAASRGMPDAAVARCAPDEVLPLDAIAAAIGRLTAVPGVRG
jgi:two-component system chemotaxis response regulator CheB